MFLLLGLGSRSLGVLRSDTGRFLEVGLGLFLLAQLLQTVSASVQSSGKSRSEFESFGEVLRRFVELAGTGQAYSHLKMEQRAVRYTFDGFCEQSESLLGLTAFH